VYRKSDCRGGRWCLIKFSPSWNCCIRIKINLHRCSARTYIRTPMYIWVRVGRHDGYKPLSYCGSGDKHQPLSKRNPVHRHFISIYYVYNNHVRTRVEKITPYLLVKYCCGGWNLCTHIKFELTRVWICVCVCVCVLYTRKSEYINHILSRWRDVGLLMKTLSPSYAAQM